MTLAIIGIIAALAAAGVAIPGLSGLFNKNKSNGSTQTTTSGFGSGIKDFFGKIGNWFKGIFNHNNAAPVDGVGVSSTSNSSVGVLDPSQSSAQSSVSSDNAGSVAGYIQDSQNGGSGFNLDNIKDLFNNLGLGFLFNNSSSEGWKSYEEIINNERQYGEGMINDARKWYQEMADTQYQRLVADLKKAGLNPWLALQSGGLSPASIPNIDTGSALGSVSTSLSQSLSNSNSNSTSAILVAVIMLLARYFAK